MKNFNIKNRLATAFLALLLIAAITGCDEYLKEESITNQTTDTYYSTPDGFENLTNSCYTLLRDIIKERKLVLSGTDILMGMAGYSGNIAGDGVVWDCYDIRMNSSLPELESLWVLLYRNINRANTVISRQDEVEGINEDVLNERVGEAKFIRAFMYFYLVQQWGDVPMPLTETESASTSVTKTKASEVYDQIISDLEDGLTSLKERGQTDYGRATVGAAEFLLARVHLTRGWNYTNINGESIGGSASDFEKAREYADNVIAKYPLADDFMDLFPKKNENPLKETFPNQIDDNAEIVFAVQFTSDPIYNMGDPTVSRDVDAQGNDYHSIFGGSPEIPGNKGRTGDYNRYLYTHVHTESMYRMFDPDLDKRYELYWVDAMYALNSVSGFKPIPGDNTTIDIASGDTVVYFPAWNNYVEDKGMDVGGTKRYAVINAEDIGRLPDSPFHPRRLIPLFWKFWEPGLDYANGLGTFDFALFRGSEAYLIAAEAILKGASNGDLGGAEAYYNRVVDRALAENVGAEPMMAKNPEVVTNYEAVSYRADGNLTIDMILDERARELMGEYNRWYDLKRTETLIERGKKYNPWMASSFCKIEEKHYLRPIPQSELDRTQPAIENNPGY